MALASRENSFLSRIFNRYPKPDSKLNPKSTLPHHEFGFDISGSQREAWESLVRATQEPGLVVLSGPTSTGKTTLLKELDLWLQMQGRSPKDILVKLARVNKFGKDPYEDLILPKYCETQVGLVKGKELPNFLGHVIFDPQKASKEGNEHLFVNPFKGRVFLIDELEPEGPHVWLLPLLVEAGITVVATSNFTVNHLNVAGVKTTEIPLNQGDFRKGDFKDLIEGVDVYGSKPFNLDWNTYLRSGLGQNQLKHQIKVSEAKTVLVHNFNLFSVDFSNYSPNQIPDVLLKLCTIMDIIDDLELGLKIDAQSQASINLDDPLMTLNNVLENSSLETHAKENIKIMLTRVISRLKSAGTRANRRPSRKTMSDPETKRITLDLFKDQSFVDRVRADAMLAIGFFT